MVLERPLSLAGLAEIAWRVGVVGHRGWRREGGLSRWWAWSNLAKVAPATGGNPGRELVSSQHRLGGEVLRREGLPGLGEPAEGPVKETTVSRLTIEDLDPTWSEWHLDRLPDVHGMPAGTGHFWTDGHGRRVEGYEAGRSCGGCGWRPNEDALPSTPRIGRGNPGRRPSRCHDGANARSPGLDSVLVGPSLSPTRRRRECNPRPSVVRGLPVSCEVRPRPTA
jgi:hypothetical protein